MKNRDSVISKFFGFLAGAVAFVMIAAYIVWFIHAKFPFIPDDGIFIKVIGYATTFVAGFVLALLVGGWASFKCGWLIRILYLLIAAAAIVFMFIPGVFDQILSLIPALQ